ncbi:hypothetical protein DL546_007652 [Coniochaeta pulveracea]|uniref:Uncharacterized protein n=1 Tax=Coniochaeta pulveracea TaxID=177199 RepID=A0A420YK85_9PEZI|nr:hypothetical protein DL546_007652 [Coniochaeta pulveracea]
MASLRGTSRPTYRNKAEVETIGLFPGLLTPGICTGPSSDSGSEEPFVLWRTLLQQAKLHILPKYTITIFFSSPPPPTCQVCPPQIKGSSSHHPSVHAYGTRDQQFQRMIFCAPEAEAPRL